MTLLNSSYDSGQSEDPSNCDDTEIWLAEWILSSGASSEMETHKLTTRTWRLATANILSLIGGPRTTHWAIEIRGFRYELQRYGYWPFFWHGYIQIERKEARKRKPFRKICIGRTELSDIEIWATVRETSKHCRAYTQLWDNCQQVLLNHFLPLVATNSQTWSKIPHFSRLIRHFLIMAYIAHLLQFLVRECEFWRTGRWTPPPPITSLFGTELLFLLLAMHPSRRQTSFGLSKNEIYGKGLRLFLSWCLICLIYFYYRKAISLYGDALCWIEDIAPPPYAPSFLPKARVWTLLHKPFEEEDRVLSFFLPIISSCRVYWWVCRFGMTLQGIVVAFLAFLQVLHLMITELDPVTCYYIFLHGRKLDVVCELWKAILLTLADYCREFGILSTGIVGEEQDRSYPNLLSTALPRGQEHRRRVVFICF